MTAKTASAAIPFLRSCEKECDEPIAGETKGDIPKWLKGTLIRVGSGLLQIGPDRYNHLFDGMALMHSFRFDNGDVRYRNRFLRSNNYERNMKANRIVMNEFGTNGAPDPCKTIFQKFASSFSSYMGDNDLVTITRYTDEIYACTETNSIWRIDPDDLKFIQKVELDKYVEVNMATAHVHEDRDGTVYNVGKRLGWKPSYNIIKFTPKKTKESDAFEGGSVICRIPVSKSLSPSYHHSFGISEGHFIFVEQPLYFPVARIMWSKMRNVPISSAMTWDPNGLTHLHVVSRENGSLLSTKFTAKALFVFHHINTYEEEGHLVVDIASYEDGEVMNALYVKAMEESFEKNANAENPLFQAKGLRFVLPLGDHLKDETPGKNLVNLSGSQATAIRQSNGSVLCEPESLTGSETWYFELPRINYEEYNGKKYKYCYAVGKKSHDDPTNLIKVDVETRATISWSELGALPSEPVFIPEPDVEERKEDSGVILASLLYKDDERKVSILVLDARNMKEIGRVNFVTESSVPGDFHGLFINNVK